VAVLPRRFYARDSLLVAPELIGCTLVRRDAGGGGPIGGLIVEVEAYRGEDDPASHAFRGETPRTRSMFGPPGRAYVYFSYGVHSLLNAVCEAEGTGAAVLIRALEPVDGIDVMRARRGVERAQDLCSGPGKLTRALEIGLSLNGSSLVEGPIEVLEREAEPRIAVGERIGITKAAELPWRFCDADSAHVSRPWPAQMRAAAA
jgi:DNA-3-methyladenine glycosylase